MKILELDIEGFRSFKKVTWKPGDLNLVIGPNGSGKSNLLKALEMLSATGRGRLSDHVTSEGGMGALVWDGQVRQICIGVRSTPISHRDENKAIHINNLLFNIILDRVGTSSGYRISKEKLAEYYRDLTKDVEAHIFFVDRDKAKWVLNDEIGAPLFVSEDLVTNAIKDEDALLPSFALPTLDNQILWQYKEWLSGWKLYQSFLTHPDAVVRSAAIARYETTIAPDGANLIQVLHTLYSENRDFKTDVNLAMKAAFGDDFEELVFPPASDQRVQLRVRWKTLKQEQSAADLSDGTLRFLYLIAILANPNPPPLIAIDEPETGLHPSMLPIIAEYARNASIHTQVILTTHSAELLDAFSEFEPTVTVASWADGQSVLKIVSEGQLQYWLEDYTLGKLFRTGGLEDMA
jgi:predicted ATPase